MAIKESYLFVCGGTDEWKEEYEPLLQTYHLMASSLNWIDRGIIQTGGLDGEGAIEASNVLEKAETLGRNA